MLLLSQTITLHSYTLRKFWPLTTAHNFFSLTYSYSWVKYKQHRSDTKKMASLLRTTLKESPNGSDFHSCGPVYISPGLCGDCGLLSVPDMAPAAGAGSRTTAVTFPTDSSLSTFRCFSCLLILIIYCLIVVKATFFSGAEKFRVLIVGKGQRQAGCKLWSERLRAKNSAVFLLNSCSVK